jgi:hypothetical protein
MAISKAFAYNPGPSIPGTNQLGNLAVGDNDRDYSSNPGGVTWYEGPDFVPGRVIAGTGALYDNMGVPINPPVTGPTFWRSENPSSESLLALYNAIKGELEAPTVTTADEAITWLNANGFYVSDAIGGKAFLVVGQNEVNDWQYWTISPNGVVGPINTGKNSADLNDFRFSPINNAGWLLEFNNWDTNEVSVNYISTAGLTLKQIPLSNDWRSRGIAQGRWAYYADWTNQIFTASDGFISVNFEWGTAGFTNYYIDWNYDAYTPAGLIMKGEQGDTHTIYRLGADTLTQNSGAGLDLYSWDNTIDDVSAIASQSWNTVTFVRVERGTNNIKMITLIDSVTGTVIESIDVEYLQYTGWNIQLYSDDKFWLVLNGTDVNDPWHIWNYNGSSSALMATTHPRGADYPSYDYWSNQATDSGYSQQTQVSEHSLLMFLNWSDQDYGTYDGMWMISFAKLSLLAIMHGDTSFRSPVVLDTGSDVGFQWDWINVSDEITFIYADFHSHAIKTQSFIHGTATPADRVLFAALNGGDNFNQFSAYNLQGGFLINDIYGSTIKRLKSNGDVTDSITGQINSNWNAGLATLFTNTADNEFWRLNTDSGEFNQIAGLNTGDWDVSEPNSCEYTPDIPNLTWPKLLYYNLTTGVGKIITNTQVLDLSNFVSQIDTNSYWNLYFGRESVSAVWWDNEVGEFKLRVWDHAGTTLASTGTGNQYTSNIDHNSYDQEMMMFVTDDGSTGYQAILISPNGVKQFIAEGYYGFMDTLPSDYPWWDC